MVFGPAEAFTPEQFAELYDVNVLSTQRVNRAVLPHMRGRGEGLVVWVSSSSSAGGTPPYLSPYFAAKVEAVDPEHLRGRGHGGGVLRPRQCGDRRRQVRDTYVWFLRMRNDRIVEAHAFFDSITFNELWKRVPYSPR